MDLVYSASRVEGFKGEITFPLLKYTERLKLMKDCQFNVTAEGAVDTGMEQLESFIKMVEYCSKAVKKVSVIHEATGAKAESFDDLESNPVFDAIINDISPYYMNAGQLGNK